MIFRDYDYTDLTARKQAERLKHSVVDASPDELKQLVCDWIEEEWEDQYNKGYDDGYRDGHREGHGLGYDEGQEDAERMKSKQAPNSEA